MKGDPFLGIKFLHAGEEYIKGLLSEDWQKLPPISAGIDPTNLCNQSCVWCMFREYRRKKPVSLTLKEVKSVIAQLADFGCKAILVTGGGEPLCNPKVLPDAFYEVIDHGMKCALLTNGVLMNKYAEAIAETCTYVRVSVDAGCRETYYKLHRDDSWDRVWRNLAELRKVYEGDLGAGFLVHEVNQMEVLNFCRLAMEYGLSYAQIKPLIPGEYQTSKHATDVALAQVEKFRSEHNFPVFVRVDRFQDLTNTEKQFKNCWATPLNAVIGADLNVYLCCMLRGVEKYSFGNLKEQTFEEIWYGERRRKIVESIDVSKCPTCRYKQPNTILESLKNAIHVEFL